MSAGYEPDRTYSYSSPLRFPPCECRNCRAADTEPDDLAADTEPDDLAADTEPDDQVERLPVVPPASEPPGYVRCPMLGCGQLHRALPENPEGIPQ
ncbi:hypothetical protein ACPCK9_26885 [Streptomyces koyangensis]|uniref:hypothetical protein n=1 Tax=Streptomyces koyangensis TaxID=188770 RepID=UPI003C2D6221